MNKAATDFTPITSSPSNPSAIGQTVTYSTTVFATSPTNPAVLVNAGTVQFYDNGTAYGSPVPVSNGVVSTTITYATSGQAGAHVITATYLPPTAAPINFLTSSTTASEQLTQTVIKASVINVSAVSDTWGQPLTYNFTVTSPQGGTPTGTVTVTENNVAVPGANVGTLASGAATITIPAGTLNNGTHTLVFTYSGDSSYAAISKTISQTVVVSSTAVNISGSTTAAYGSTVSYSGVVQSTVTPIVTLTGTANGTTTVTGLSSTGTLVVGMAVTGTGIPAGTTIAAINSTSQITLSQAATGSGAVALQFGRFDPIAGTVKLFIDSTGTTNPNTNLLAAITLSGSNAFSFSNVPLLSSTAAGCSTRFTPSLRRRAPITSRAPRRPIR